MSEAGSYKTDKPAIVAGSAGGLKARFEQMAQKGDEVCDGNVFDLHLKN